MTHGDGKYSNKVDSILFLNDRLSHRYGNGATSLMIMAGSLSAIQYIISRNMDNADFINAQDAYGQSALIYACLQVGKDARGVELSVKLLTSFPSVDIHLRDRWNMSALECALYSENLKAIPILLGHPSWSPQSIRKAVIAAVQNSFYSLKLLDILRGAKEVQRAFSWNLGLGGRADWALLASAPPLRKTYREKIPIKPVKSFLPL